MPLQVLNQRPPNVVLVVADDLGYGDLSCYGNPDFKTPNIDELASTGVRMTAGYVTCSICGPSRAGLITGYSGTRYGFEYNLVVGFPNADQYGLPTTVPTLAERMQARGYETLMVGKWHLGVGPDKTPLTRGFDHFFGFYEGQDNYFPPTFMNPVWDDTQPAVVTDYLTKAFTNKAKDYINTYKDRPFFLYLPYNCCHFPWEAPPNARYRYLNLPNPRRKIAAMTSIMDQGIGEIRSTLRQANLLQNTIFIFVSDNGGATRDGASSNRPFSKGKNTFYEGGIRVPYIFSWPGHVPRGIDYKMPVSTLDIVPTVLANTHGATSEALGDSVPLEGVDLVPHLKRPNDTRWAYAPHESLFWRKGDTWAARYRNFKLRRGLYNGAISTVLVDLDQDIQEASAITTNPTMFKKVQDMYNVWNASNIPPLWIYTGKNG